MSYIDNTRRSNNDAFELSVCLTEGDCKVLLPFFRNALKKVHVKLEKYRDIHEGGEATEKQENLLAKYEEESNALEKVLKDIQTLLA